MSQNTSALNISSLRDKPIIMGVLNITPDSFYDGGRFVDGCAQKVHLDKARDHAQNMVNAGAKIIDVGGESTRPDAKTVSVQEELDRVIPIIEALSQQVDAVISVDTSKPAVMREAVNAGAGLLNDVRAFTCEGALDVAVALQQPICMMHMQGSPSMMQQAPTYGCVETEVREYLLARAQAAIDAGVKQQNIILDPGFGFGKTDTHNLTLLKKLNTLCELGYPILVGLSRKSLIGRLLGREPKDRLAGSLALAMLAVQAGAGIIRVHDVAQTRDVLTMLELVGSVSAS